MIVDLNLRGKRVAVFGAGREASRKVSGLLTQDCLITVFADSVHEEILNLANKGKLQLKVKNVIDCSCLENLDDLILVIAATDDKELNKLLAASARRIGCYAYCVDDPDNSDFSHPSVINLKDTVMVTVSTGGRSPLMSRRLREKLEPIINATVSSFEISQIKLQDKIRSEVKKEIPLPEARKQFLIRIADDLTIKRLLDNNQFEDAEKMARDLLRGFRT